MKRINLILQNTQFRDCLKRIEAAEKDRIFCGHDLVHLLDVCRLAWILYQEEERKGTLGKIDREWIYAAGLLHDIGRWKQYEDGTPHEIVGSSLAKGILTECGFGAGETKAICEAIGNHRNEGIGRDNTLSGLLYRADKMSRACFGCKAEALCNWSRKKKNLELLL